MLKAINVSKTYDLKTRKITPLRNITFVLDDKDFAFLIGKSGAGKTTLLRLLFLEEKPTSGKIFFNKLDITSLDEKLMLLYRQHVGVIFQDYKLLEYRTARENIEFILEILNKPKKEIQKITDYLLELVELTDRADLYPSQLSGGEKRRIAIARAVANRPKLLLADEPTGDLDIENSKLIMDILERINESGTAIIMSTHRPDLLETYKKNKHIWKLEDGILYTNVDTKHIKDLYKKTTTKLKIKDPLLSKLKNSLSVITSKKLFRIRPKSIKEILSLSPKQLKEELDFTSTELEELKRALIKLEK